MYQPQLFREAKTNTALFFQHVRVSLSASFALRYIEPHQIHKRFSNLFPHLLFEKRKYISCLPMKSSFARFSQNMDQRDQIFVGCII